MNECTGNNFILNGDLVPSEMFDRSLIYDGESVYEVLKMSKGSPVFFEDHLERLIISTRLQKKKNLADSATIRENIMKLVKKEKKRDCNLKIVFNYNKSESNYLVYFIETIYPSVSQYQKGVKGILFFAERRDPESKVVNHKLRSAISSRLIAESAYEAILVNEDHQITEGSRSNIFFLKDNLLYTAPDNAVLKGITRKYILDLCRENNIEVRFKCIDVEELKDFDAAFMTGTSPVVLPFYSIGEYRFKVSFPVIEHLRALYTVKAEQSIERFRNIN